MKRKDKRDALGHRVDPGYRVDVNGCHIYKGFIDPTTGYPGVLKAPDGTRQRAHRVYYMRARGPIPKGLHLDHLCRVRACVNAEHLEPVTHKENCRRGASTRLSESDVAYIRAHARPRMKGANGDGSINAMALRFGVSQPYISMLIGGHRWAS